MNLLSENELNNISGGGFGFVIGMIVVGLVTFTIGVIDGFVRPFTCRK